jgi:hypothetical protein
VVIGDDITILCDKKASRLTEGPSLFVKRENNDDGWFDPFDHGWQVFFPNANGRRKPQQDDDMKDYYFWIGNLHVSPGKKNQPYLKVY